MPTCVDLYLNQDETDIDCGGQVCEPCDDGKKCLLDRDCKSDYCYQGRCRTPTCNDGIQNCHIMPDGSVLCEEGIDCGGPCEPCAERKYAKLPFVDAPALIALAKTFPWWLLLILCIIIIAFLSTDRTYAHYLSRINREEYRRKVRPYKALRKKMLKVLLNICFIMLTAAAYIYMTSTCTDCFIRNIWILLSVFIATPFAVSFAINQYFYSQYRKERLEKRLELRHDIEMNRLMRMEGKLMLDMEEKCRNDIYELTKKTSFEYDRQNYLALKEIYDFLSLLCKARKKTLEINTNNTETEQKIDPATKSRSLKKLSKDFMLFRSALSNLNEIKKSIRQERDTYNHEREFIEDIKDIAEDRHLTAVIKGNKTLVSDYNQLVSIYNTLEEKHRELNEAIKTTKSMEDDFAKKVSSASRGQDVTIERDPEFKGIYDEINGLTDAYSNRKEQTTQAAVKQRG